MARTGIVLVAQGGPSSLEDVDAYLRAVNGHEPDADDVASERRKYLTIGGFSPLPMIAERVASALERRLSGLEDAEENSSELGGIGFMVAESTRAIEGVESPVLVGMLHYEPSLEGALDGLSGRGAERIIVVPSSPFFAPADKAAMREAIEGFVREGSVLEVMEATVDHVHPRFVTVLGDACQIAISDLEEARKPFVILTSESLPREDSTDGSQVTLLQETAGRVARRAGLSTPSGSEPQDGLGGLVAFGGSGEGAAWALAFQSGTTGPGRLGPDLLDVIDAVDADVHDSIVVCPLDPTFDCAQTLYDLDVLAAERVYGRDLDFGRARVPNDSPDLIETLESAVRPLL